VSAGEKQVAVHVPLRQHGPISGAHGHAPPTEPDPTGVFEMSSLNFANAPTLMADPPQRQLVGEQ